jgi:hypothetical protein
MTKSSVPRQTRGAPGYPVVVHAGAVKPQTTSLWLHLLQLQAAMMLPVGCHAVLAVLRFMYAGPQYSSQNQAGKGLVCLGQEQTRGRHGVDQV